MSERLANILVVTGEPDEARRGALQKEVAGAAGLEPENVTVYQVGRDPNAGLAEEVYYIGHRIRTQAIQNGPVTMVAEGQDGFAGVVAFGENHRIVDRVVSLDAPVVRLGDSALPDGSKGRIVPQNGREGLGKALTRELPVREPVNLRKEKPAA